MNFNRTKMAGATGVVEEIQVFNTLLNPKPLKMAWDFFTLYNNVKER